MSAPYAPTINAGGKLMELSRPMVMGILNATPDSFYAGSRRQGEAEIEARADQIVAEGGDIIDVGAYSTRPGAAPVSEEEETRRLRMALAAVRRAQPGAVVSVDTFRPDVARMAAEEYGAAIINDVSGGNPQGAFGGTQAEAEAWPEGYVPPIFAMAARLGLPYVLMSSAPTLGSVMLDLSAKTALLHSIGVKDVIADPGFGFGKTVEQNFAIMASLERLGELGLPVLVGVSRKSMVTRTLGCTADEALPGTIALNAIALTKGAAILRVHDVKEAAQCARLAVEMGKGLRTQMPDTHFC